MIKNFRRKIRQFIIKLADISPESTNRGKAEIYPNINVSKGYNVHIENDCYLVNCRFGNHIKIGRNSYMHNVDYGDYSYNSWRVTLINCSIGKFCSIAQGVSAGLGKHPVSDFISSHPAFYSLNKQCGFTFASTEHFREMGKIQIGNDVWIGANAIIMDDVNIGNGAVISANSFVNIDVPPYSIVGGTPAKVIKYRFSDDVINFLEEFKWWNKDEKWLKSNSFKFLNPELFYKEFAYK
jgi:acetyltransferase-like isoleucine patch superfamily enzyme